MKQIISQRKSSKSGVGLVLATTLLLIVLSVLHINATHRADLPLLLGDRVEAMFDLWSLQHFGSGVLIGSLLVYGGVASKSLRDFALVVLLLALSWEAAELAMESGWFSQTVATWKRGYEHWGNRFVGDPTLVILGGMVTRRFKSCWKIVLIPCIVWLIVNIALPHSMSVNQIVFGP